MKKYYEFKFYRSNMMNVLKNPSRRKLLSDLSDEYLYSNNNIKGLKTPQIMELTVKYLSNRLFPLMKSLQDSYGHVFVNNLALEDDSSFASVYFNISSNLFKIRKGKSYMPEPKTVKEGGIQITFDGRAKDNRFKVSFQEKLGFDEKTYGWDEDEGKWVKLTLEEKRKKKKARRWASSLRSLIYGIPQIDYWIQSLKVFNKDTKEFEYYPTVYKIDRQFKDLKTNNEKLIRAIESSGIFKKQESIFNKYKNTPTSKIPQKERYFFFQAQKNFKPKTGKWRILEAELLNDTISVANKGYLINEFGVFFRKGRQITTQKEAKKAYEQLSKHLIGSNIFDVLSTEKNERGQLENTSYFINSVQFNDLSPQVENQITQKKELIGKDLSITIQFSFDRLKNEFSSSMRILDENNSTLGFFIDKFASKEITDKVREQRAHFEKSTDQGGLGLKSFEYRVIDLYYGNIVQPLQEFIESNFDKFLENPKKYIESSEKDLDEYDQKLLKRTLSSVFDFEIEGENTTTVVDTIKPTTEPIKPTTEPVTETRIVFTDKERLIIENLAARFSYLSQKKKDKPTDTEPPPVDRPDQTFVWDHKSDSYTVYGIEPKSSGGATVKYTGMHQLAFNEEKDVVAFYHPDQGTYILLDYESGDILNRKYKLTLYEATEQIVDKKNMDTTDEDFRWGRYTIENSKELYDAFPTEFKKGVELVLKDLFVGDIKTMTSPVYNEQWRKTNITDRHKKYEYLKDIARLQMTGTAGISAVAFSLPKTYEYSQTVTEYWMYPYLSNKKVHPTFFWIAQQIYNPRIPMEYIQDALTKRTNEALSLQKSIKEREERLKSSSKTK